MVLVLYVLWCIIGKIGWISQQANMNKEAFKRTYDPKTNTFVDWKGIKRDVITGQPYVIVRDFRTGDYVQKDKDWNTIKNFSAENRKNKYEIDGDYSVYPLTDIALTSQLKGIRYRDKENGRLYVVREFLIEDSNTKKCKFVPFFMDEQTLHLVRMIDFYDKIYKDISKEIIDDFIKTFNYNQDNYNGLSWKKYYNENVGEIIDKDIFK